MSEIEYRHLKFASLATYSIDMLDDIEENVIRNKIDLYEGSPYYKTLIYTREYNHHVYKTIDRFKFRKEINDPFFLKNVKGIPAFFLSEAIRILMLVSTKLSEEDHFLYKYAIFLFNIFIYVSIRISYQKYENDHICILLDSVLNYNYNEFHKILNEKLMSEKVNKHNHRVDMFYEEKFSKLEDFNKYITEASCYDDLYPVENLFLWKKEVEDYKYCLSCEPKISDGNLERFRHQIRKSLSEINIPLDIAVSTEDILLNMSENASYDPYNYHKGKKDTVSFRINLKQNIERILNSDVLMSKRENVYKRSQAFVSPENTRDIFIADLETKICNSYYDLLIRNIFINHQKNLMVPEQKMQERISRIMKHNKLYLMLDIKKSGLTLEHDLIKVLFEELDILTKNNFNFSRHFERIKNQDLIVDDEYFKTKRGMGLGMMNSMYTAIMLIISDMIENDGIFFSDDNVFCLNTDSEQEIEKILFLYEDYNFLINYRKIKISEMFIILEQYYKEEDIFPSDKDTRVIMPLFNQIFTENNVKRKNSIYGLIRSQLIGDSIGVCLYLLIAKLGFLDFNRHDFLSYEYYAPPKFGGFGIKNYQSCFDDSLLFLDDILEEDISIAQLFIENPKLNKDIVRFDQKKIFIENNKYKKLKENIQNFLPYDRFSCFNENININGRLSSLTLSKGFYNEIINRRKSLLRNERLLKRRYLKEDIIQYYIEANGCNNNIAIPLSQAEYKYKIEYKRGFYRQNTSLDRLEDDSMFKLKKLEDLKYIENIKPILYNKEISSSILFNPCREVSTAYKIIDLEENLKYIESERENLLSWGFQPEGIFSDLCVRSGRIPKSIKTFFNEFKEINSSFIEYYGKDDRERSIDGNPVKISEEIADTIEKIKDMSYDLYIEVISVYNDIKRKSPFLLELVDNILSHYNSLYDFRPYKSYEVSDEEEYANYAYDYVDEDLEISDFEESEQDVSGMELFDEFEYGSSFEDQDLY